MNHGSTIMPTVIVLALSASPLAHASPPVETTLWKLAVASTIGLIYLTGPMDVDAMAFELGSGEDVAVGRIAGRWDWKQDLLRVRNYRVDSYVQVEYSKWQSTLDSDQTGANNSLGLIPMFRIVGDWGTVKPYLDTGVGFNAIAETKISGNELTTVFQFSDQMGTGVQFGDRRQWELGYRFQHYSNNSLGLPNNGFNLHLLTVSYRYPQREHNAPHQ